MHNEALYIVMWIKLLNNSRFSQNAMKYSDN